MNDPQTNQNKLFRQFKRFKSNENLIILSKHCQFSSSTFSSNPAGNWSLCKDKRDLDALSFGSTCSKPGSRLKNHTSLEKTHQSPQNDAPQTKILKKSSDLFELLERCQSQRLDDQRCVLPSYFKQVSLLLNDS